jgi:diacylglycerol O-acyltransferase/trehalose O-mycolyltransferase
MMILADRGGRMPRRVMALVAFVCCLTIAGCAEPNASPPAAYQTPTPNAAARIVATRRIDTRTRDITVDSPAVGKQVKVRLLLPADFATSTRRWPVLYLLHGCCDSYVSWTRSTDIEKLTGKAGMIVAMPDGGAVGFYSDWLVGPKWETFHTVELPELLASNYRASDRRAIAGLSMGGLGALGYAARHPGSYASAASFSGIVHTRLSKQESQGYLGLVQSQGEDPAALWGDPTTDVDVWREHNPYDLAAQLKAIPIFVSAGNGQRGPLDKPGAGVDEIEQSIGAENKAFASRLRELGAGAQIDLYGPGTHNWVYWQRELHKAWPMITASLR